MWLISLIAMDRSQGNDVLNTGVTHDLPIFLFGFLKDARGARKLAAATGSLQAYISGSGPGGAGGQREGHTRPLVRNKHIKTRLTSPSHRFLPFLQAVHARWPRLGMCPGGIMFMPSSDGPPSIAPLC